MLKYIDFAVDSESIGYTGSFSHQTGHEAIRALVVICGLLGRILCTARTLLLFFHVLLFLGMMAIISFGDNGNITRGVARILSRVSSGK
jgi:hypothetical protein